MKKLSMKRNFWRVLRTLLRIARIVRRVKV